MPSEFGKSGRDGAGRTPDPWEQDRINREEADQERTGWMQPGLHIRRGPLGCLRGLGLYFGATVALPFGWAKRKTAERLKKKQVRHEQRRLRRGK